MCGGLERGATSREPWLLAAAAAATTTAHPRAPARPRVTRRRRPTRAASAPTPHTRLSSANSCRRPFARASGSRRAYPWMGNGRAIAVGAMGWQYGASALQWRLGAFGGFWGVCRESTATDRIVVWGPVSYLTRSAIASRGVYVVCQRCARVCVAGVGALDVGSRAPEEKSDRRAPATRRAPLDASSLPPPLIHLTPASLSLPPSIHRQRSHQAWYAFVVIESALPYRSSHTVWCHPSASSRSYVCEPKKSRCACTRLAGRRARRYASK